MKLESMEPRVMLSVDPPGLSPAQVRAAYGFDQIVFQTVKGPEAGDGTGQTIAIVDAYHAPTVAADLDVFDKVYSVDGSNSLYVQYGAASSFLKVHKMSLSIFPHGGWAQEASLDVQWAHAIAPGAKILLVEAKSGSIRDLLAAVDYARRQPDVSAVSMSWGGSEFFTQGTYDAYFMTPKGHVGVTFAASSGDSGAGSSWPAVSPNVMAVGGTSLYLSGGAYAYETGWSGSGGDVSQYSPAPAWQKSSLGFAWRGTPDVAYDADPATGFAVYDSFDYNGQSGWMRFGGTSAVAPQWAALVAIANQGRELAGKQPLDGTSQTMPAIYAMKSLAFHDVTSGDNGWYGAGPGYDLVTGRGSPVAQNVVSSLVSYGGVAQVAPTRRPAVSRWTRWFLNPQSDTGVMKTMSVVARGKGAATRAV